MNVGVSRSLLRKLGFSLGRSVAKSLPGLASPPFASWQWRHVKWLHSWTVNSKACAPTAAWQEEGVIFCMELNSFLSSSDLQIILQSLFLPTSSEVSAAPCKAGSLWKQLERDPWRQDPDNLARDHFYLVERLGMLGENRLCPWDGKWWVQSQILSCGDYRTG